MKDSNVERAKRELIRAVDALYAAAAALENLEEHDDFCAQDVKDSIRRAMGEAEDARNAIDT